MSFLSVYTWGVVIAFFIVALFMKKNSDKINGMVNHPAVNTGIVIITIAASLLSWALVAYVAIVEIIRFFNRNK